MTAAKADRKVTEDVWNENPRKEQQGSNWRRAGLGGRSAAPASVCSFQPSRNDAPAWKINNAMSGISNRRQVNMQVTFPHQLKGYIQMQLQLFSIACLCCRASKSNNSITAYMFTFPVYLLTFPNLPELSVAAKLSLQSSAERSSQSCNYKVTSALTQRCRISKAKVIKIS